VSAITTTTSADYLGGDAAYHTLNQAAVAGLTTTDGPTWDHVHITNNADIGGAYQVDSVQVVSNRQAAIAEPAETAAANTATIKYMLDTLAAHGLLTAQEKLLNGGFDSDTANWGTLYGCTVASVAGGQSGNCLEMTKTGGATQYVAQAVNGLTIGRSYTFTAYVKSGTAGDVPGHIYAFDTSWTEAYGTYFVSEGSWLKYTLIFTPVSYANWYFELEKADATDGTLLFDTASLKVTQ